MPCKSQVPRYQNSLSPFAITIGFVFGMLLAITMVSRSLASSPKSTIRSTKSGVPVGSLLTAFAPSHVTGPDKGTTTCPVCMYPYNPAIQVWLNGDAPANISALVTSLEKTINAHQDVKMKAFVIFTNADRQTDAVMEQKLDEIGKNCGVKSLDLAYIAGPDDHAISDYKINLDPKVRNTIFVYKKRTVTAKFVNLVADSGGLQTLNSAIDRMLKQN